MENEIMNTENEGLVAEEEYTDCGSGIDVKTIGLVGAAMIVGGLAHKFVVQPIGKKVKTKIGEFKQRKLKDAEIVEDAEFVEVEEEESK